jgi:CAAX prenyl protease-like protein
MCQATLARALPFGAFIAFIALDPWLRGIAENGSMDPRWWYGVRVATAGVLLLWFWREYEELRTLAAAGVRDWVLAVAVGAAVFVVWIHLDVWPLAFSGSTGFDPRAGASIDWPLALVRLAGAALVVPVMEELFWRSLVMRWIQRTDFLKVAPAEVGGRALVVSAALFALEHHLWFAGLLAGLAYGWLYVRCGNLWAPTLAHAVTNAMLGVWVLQTGNWQFW